MRSMAADLGIERAQHIQCRVEAALRRRSEDHRLLPSLPRHSRQPPASFPHSCDACGGELPRSVRLPAHPRSWCMAVASERTVGGG
jgi:hypothetical protein